jgi:RNAse (barnase) inhibitor barstar
MISYDRDCLWKRLTNEVALDLRVMMVEVEITYKQGR